MLGKAAFIWLKIYILKCNLFWFKEEFLFIIQVIKHDNKDIYNVTKDISNRYILFIELEIILKYHCYQI